MFKGILRNDGVDSFVINEWQSNFNILQVSSSAIAERPRCRVGYLWPKVKDWNWEKIFTDNIGLYSTTATYLASKEIDIAEKNAK